MSYSWFDLIGNLGVLLIVGSYLMLQLGRIDTQGAAYSLVNLIGALLIMISLIVDFNLSAFVIECFWVLISLVGLLRLRRRRHPKNR